MKSLTDEILDKASEVEAALIEHPFFQALLADDIPESAYFRWVREDTFFAQSVRRSLAVLIAKAPDERSIDVLAAAYKPLNDELELFLNEAKRGAVEMSGGPAQPTRKFIDLMSFSASDGFAHGVGAYWATERFYLDLWQTLLPRGGTGRYAHWFATWTASPFPEWVGALGEVVDEHGERSQTVGPALEVFECERLFWDHCWSGGE